MSPCKKKVHYRTVPIIRGIAADIENKLLLTLDPKDQLSSFNSS